MRKSIFMSFALILFVGTSISGHCGSDYGGDKIEFSDPVDVVDAIEINHDMDAIKITNTDLLASYHLIPIRFVMDEFVVVNNYKSNGFDFRIFRCARDGLEQIL